MYPFASRLVLTLSFLSCLSLSRARIPGVWLGSEGKSLQATASGWTGCEEFCKKAANDGGSTFAGFGQPVGTAPYCEATCDNDCWRRACKPGLEDGNKCLLRGEKICCCAVVGYTPDGGEVVIKPESYPVGVLMTRTLFRDSVSQFKKEAIRNILKGFMNKGLGGEELVKDGDNLFVRAADHPIKKLDVGGVMMDVQSHNTMWVFGVQVTLEFEAYLEYMKAMGVCKGDVRVTLEKMMLMVWVGFSEDSRNNDNPLRDMQIHFTGYDLDVEVFNIHEEERDACSKINTLGSGVVPRAVLSALPDKVREAEAEIRSQVMSAIDNSLWFKVADTVLSAKTRMVGRQNRSLWTVAQVGAKWAPSQKCEKWSGQTNECAAHIAVEVNTGNRNLGLAIHDWQAGNVLCEVAEGGSPSFSFELGSVASVLFWTMVAGQGGNTYENGVKIGAFLAADPEPKMVSSESSPSSLYLSLGVSFRGRKKETKEEVDLLILSVRMIFGVGFRVRSGSLTPKVDLKEVEQAKVLDSKVETLGVKVVLDVVRRILNGALMVPVITSYIESLIPSIQLPSYLSVSDTELYTKDRCVYFTTRADMDMEKLLKSVLDSRAVSQTDSPTVLPLPVDSLPAAPTENPPFMAFVRTGGKPPSAQVSVS
uniref:Uncharacterized protein n=1 Tax=Chromera velia CCMP2878 TaxID=1169474 RepID=A0A0G4EZF8_9ALVE|eukprot:Cvel_14185.t1-p1 / transcript=Cvel_14185.t1 / gene=Cvel_14185 / organism=Chromera_velia_CCMP2878 / gene_product=hypothetical protein / transcript_product=hypothetical protein / location=Cvel_scaffold1000:25946-27886(+) / protein_length=647 / sequence_SO=supercontig / SO=protein_coding / is_pseudo=false